MRCSHRVACGETAAFILGMILAGAREMTSRESAETGGNEKERGNKKAPVKWGLSYLEAVNSEHLSIITFKTALTGFIS